MIKMKTVLDLFCGAGGFSLGFRTRNYKIIGVDNWHIAGITWKENIRGEFIESDVMALDIDTLPKVDILIGSPPCPQFSTANPHKTLDLKLVMKFLEIKRKIKPEYWIMEEVPLVGTECKKLRILKPRYLWAKDFGLPHERKRLFAGNYPVPDKNPYKGMLLPTPLAKMWGYFANSANRDRDRENFKKYFNTEEKYPTIEHYRVLMGFPERFHFSGCKDHIYRMLGNAVCPPISIALRRAIENKKTILDYLNEANK